MWAKEGNRRLLTKRVQGITAFSLAATLSAPQLVCLPASRDLCETLRYPPNWFFILFDGQLLIVRGSLYRAAVSAPRCN